MYKLYKDPGGELILMEQRETTEHQSSDNVDYSDDAYRNKVEILNKEMNQLRDEIYQVH